MKLYNTLTKRKEEFKPIKKGNVGIYSCGPTVYSYAHIGNLRTYIFNDILKRTFLFNKYKVKHVMNITDVDDKTIKGSREEDMSLKQFTKKYEDIFLRDIKELNIILPDYMPKATNHISEMVELIKKLLEKGYAYKADDGIYFSVSKFKNYGKLSGLGKIKNVKSRIKNDEYDKKNIQDFSLWKFYTDEDIGISWDVEIGKGRPGWHIECSAMSSKYLGEHFDIHTGGQDLIFPHHTNEIAQSEAATGKKFVNYWVHAGLLAMKTGKMSKSKGNIYTLKDLKEKGFEPLHYRYFCLATHYRSPLLFSFEALENAKNSYDRLRNILREIKDDGTMNSSYLEEFKSAVNDDLNIPGALEVLWKLVRDETSGKLATISEMDKVLGLDLLKKEEIKIPEEIRKLVEERGMYRRQKKFKEADMIREKINKLGWIIDDTDKGVRLRKNG